MFAVIATLAGGLVACGGGGSSSSSTAAEVTPSTVLALTAKNLKFDKKALATTANADVVLSYDNEDSGTLHNLSIYQSKDGKGKIFTGDLFAGKKSVEYRFRAPDTGVYYFRCDAHPDMNGTLTVKAP